MTNLRKHSRVLVGVLFLALLGVVGCVQPSPESESAAAPGTDDPAAAGDPAVADPAGLVEPEPAAEPAARSTGGSPPPAKPAAPPAPSFVTVRVPAGTELEVELLDTLSSGVSQVGDPVRGRLTNDLHAEGRLVAAAGTELYGAVAEVVPLKKFGGRPQISVAFDSLRVRDGDPVPVRAEHTETGKKQAGRDAAKIGGSVVAGAVLGHQVDDDKGKEIGAVLGGAIGTVIAAKTGKEIELAAGSTITVAVQNDVEIRLPS